MLAVKHDISYEILPSPINLELIIIKIISSSPIIYCVVYIPPKSSAADEYLHELYEFLMTLKSISDSLVLLGDFNFNDINWESLYGNSPVSAKFCEIIFDLNLCQLVSEPTHIHGNILDLVLTNNPDNIVDLIVHSKPPFSISSDHFVITFRIYSRIVHSTCKVGSRLRYFSTEG